MFPWSVPAKPLFINGLDIKPPIFGNRHLQILYLTLGVKRLSAGKTTLFPSEERIHHKAGGLMALKL